MDSPRASRTAVLMCQGRAVADGRWALGRFQDPIARSLLRHDERALVDQARDQEVPADWRQRLVVESVRAAGEVVVPRTVAIDEAVCGTGHDQVVILGAGLDSRPWRLSCLRDADVYAVDHPSSQADANERAAGLPLVARRLIPIAIDLGAGGLDRALADAGHDGSVPTTWVWEGVIPYLTRDQVAATTAAVARRSALGSVLIANYQRRSLVTVWGRRVGRVVARQARLDDPLADEPWLSLWTPTTIQPLLARHSFTAVRDEDLLTIATRLGSPATRRRSLASGHFLVANR